MNLSLKQKALLQTSGMLVTCVIAGIVTSLIFQFVSVNAILNVLGVGIMTFIVYLMYQINLSQLKYKEKLQETVDKK